MPVTRGRRRLEIGIHFGIRSLRIHLEGEDFLAEGRNGYRGDTLFSQIIANTEQHARYALRDGVLYFTNAVGDPVVAIPGSLSKERRVTEIAVDQVHRIIGHKAARKTRDYLMDPVNCHAPNVTTGFQMTHNGG
jgi:hypothetical protein